MIFIKIFQSLLLISGINSILLTQAINVHYVFCTYRYFVSFLLFLPSLFLYLLLLVLLLFITSNFYFFFSHAVFGTDFVKPSEIISKSLLAYFWIQSFTPRELTS